MFYTMMKDLQANHFIPPVFTTYNNLNIPFAYPPLALYIGAGISSLFNISLIKILQWLPPLINSLCVLFLSFSTGDFGRQTQKHNRDIDLRIYTSLEHLAFRGRRVDAQFWNIVHDADSYVFIQAVCQK